MSLVVPDHMCHYKDIVQLHQFQILCLNVLLMNESSIPRLNPWLDSTKLSTWEGKIAVLSKNYNIISWRYLKHHLERRLLSNIHEQTYFSEPFTTPVPPKFMSKLEEAVRSALHRNACPMYVQRRMPAIMVTDLGLQSYSNLVNGWLHPFKTLFPLHRTITAQTDHLTNAYCATRRHFDKPFLRTLQLWCNQRLPITSSQQKNVYILQNHM